MSSKGTRVKPHTPTSHIYTYLSSRARQCFEKKSRISHSMCIDLFLQGHPVKHLGNKSCDHVLPFTVVGD